MHSQWNDEVNTILLHIKSYSNPWITREFAFKKGREYYENTNYFEAHEIWEFQWKKERGDIKIFLQALIQIAICLNKIYKEPNLKGCTSLASKAKGKLDYILESDFFNKKGKEFLYVLDQFCKEILEKEDLESMKQVPYPTIYQNNLYDLFA